MSALCYYFNIYSYSLGGDRVGVFKDKYISIVPYYSYTSAFFYKGSIYIDHGICRSCWEEGGLYLFQDLFPIIIALGREEDWVYSFYSR